MFNGETADEADVLSFDVKPHIVYPMEGGTAFITFEEEDGVKNSSLDIMGTYFLDYDCYIVIVSLRFCVLLLSC